MQPAETTAERLYYCSDTGDRLPLEKVRELGSGEFVTLDCEHNTCEHCGDTCYQTYEVRGRRGERLQVCERCESDEFRLCDDCGEIHHQDNVRYTNWDNTYCDECYSDHREEDGDEDEDSGSNTYCNVENCDKLRSKVFGQIIKHKRTFGVELECGFNDYDKLKSFVESTEHFGVVSDGSVSCSNYSREIVSPILQGQAGEIAILKVCKDLNSSGATVDKSCGYHLHLGASELKASFSKMRALIAFYMIYDKLFFQYLPASREKNRYCIPLAKKYGEYFGNETVRKEIDKKLYGTSNAYQIKREKSCKYADCRYSSVNLHSIYYRGTLEVRSHSGTLDSIKVLEWANLHGLILEKIISGKIDYDYSESCKGDTIDILEKKLFDILRLKESSQQYFRNRRAKFQRDTLGESVQDSDEPRLVVTPSDLRILNIINGGDIEFQINNSEHNQ